MQVTYVVRFQVLPDKIERFLSLLNDVLDAMRDELEFRHAVLHRDPDSPCRLMLYETWESPDEDGCEEQIHKPYRRAYHEALSDLLVRPREVTMWHTMRSDSSFLADCTRRAEVPAGARA